MEYHHHLTNTEIGTIKTFNRREDGFRLDYNGRTKKFVLTDSDTGRVIDSGHEVWDLVNSGLQRELDTIERISPRRAA